MRVIYFSIILFFNQIGYAEIIKINCVHPNSHQFVVNADNVKRTVSMNEEEKSTKAKFKSDKIKWNLKNPDDGTQYIHAINLKNGAMTIKTKPGGNVDKLQCTKIPRN
jgi:hypothetical protein